MFVKLIKPEPLTPSLTLWSYTMTFSVAKLSPELILPAEPTPSGNLPLSWLDKYPTQRGLIGSLHVFKHGEEPAAAIRAGLSKALVFYYPLAGRLVLSEQGELMVSCDSEGVWFVEASTECCLEEVGGLEHPPAEAEENLLPHPLPGADYFEESKNLLMLQITSFKCGGFVVGLRMNHAITDGLGAGQLLGAIGDMSRGLTEPTVLPIWHRESVPTPSKKPIFGPPPALKDMDVQHLIVDVPLHRITTLKDEYTAATGLRCSAFDLLITKAWQYRTQSIRLEPEVEVQLCFSMSTRHLLKDVLPSEGSYYGNCYYNMKVSAPAGRVVHASVPEIVKMIKEAKSKLPGEYEKFMKGELTADPYLTVPTYESLGVSDWSRLGLNEVNYGWGTPVHAVPLLDMVCFPMCVILRPPVPKVGARFIVKSVNKQHFKEFSELMMKMA